MYENVPLTSRLEIGLSANYTKLCQHLINTGALIRGVTKAKSVSAWSLFDAKIA